MARVLAHPASMAATVKHLKQFEKIFLGIRENTDEKLAQLRSEFLDHQEWLKKAVVDTKESKDGLGLVCPATVRKAKTASSRTAPKDEADKENVDNGGKSSRSKRSIKSTAAKSVNGDDDLDVFDPENDAQLQQPSKTAKNAAKDKAGSDARGKNMEGKTPAEREKELSKLKVVQLKEELQKRGLPSTGKKDELVARLASAMEVEETQPKPKPVVEFVVGKDVSPYVGMRVRHESGNDHRSSKGLLGTVEIIPGRGALKPDERSVSVRWDADMSDVRGPYYTGEPCDRGSGIGTEKFDLTTLQEMNEEEQAPIQHEALDDKPTELETAQAPQEVPFIVEGLQEPAETKEVDADGGADADAADVDEAGEHQVMEVEEETQRLPSPVSMSDDKEMRKLSGSKRKSDGELKDDDDTEATAESLTGASPAATASVQALQQRLNQCKQAWTQRMSTDAQSPSPARPKVLRTPVLAKKEEVKEEPEAQAEEQSRPVRSTRNSSAKKPAAVSTPAKQVSTPAAAASSNKKARGMPTAMEPGVSLCSSAKKAAQPVGPTSQPHESVQHFRAIISRINAEKGLTDSAASSAAAALPPRAATTSKLPGAYTSSASVTVAREETAALQASKPVTWPPPPLKATGIKLTEGTETKSSRLTSERLSAHIKSEGKHSMLHAFAGSPAVSATANGSRGVAPEASSESMNDAGKKVMDAAARQQRAAENRARMEEEIKRKAADQERRRKELENKRLEAEKIAKDRRDKEAKEQQDRVDAAKRRAQEEEERRIKAVQEQDERKRQERERAEQQEKDRLEKERQERELKDRQIKELERTAAEAAAAAAAAKKPSVPVFAGTSNKTPNTNGFFGAIGSVFKGVMGTPGTGDAAPPTNAPTASSAVASLKQKEPADQGPTSIKIIETKNSDDSDSEDEGKKQPVPVWAQSPNLRRQLHRQVDVSPTPVFGECKKTCDLAAMFVNHQPKRRRYDKRTSSANWGDDGGSSFMAEQRFEQQVKHNIAMQNSD